MPGYSVENTKRFGHFTIGSRENNIYTVTRKMPLSDGCVLSK